MPSNTTILNVGVVIDPPFVISNYSSVEPSDSTSERITKSGTEFELFIQIFKNILNMSMNFTEFPSYEDEYYEKLQRGELDILLTRESIRYFFNDLYHLDGNVTASPSMLDNRLMVYHKQHYRNGPVKLLDHFKVDTVATIILVSILVYWLNYFAKKYCNRRKMPFSVLWFLFITVILGLFSNLIAVDLTTHSKLPIQSFKNMRDLVEKWVSGECEALTLSNYAIDGIENSARGRERHIWLPRLILALQRRPPKEFLTRREIADEIMRRQGCTFVFDYKSLQQFYLHQYNGLGGNEMVEDISPIDYVYLMNKNTMSLDFQETIRQVLCSDSIRALPNKIEKIYYAKTIQGIQSENSAMFGINIYKVIDPVKILLIGLAGAFLSAIFENFIS